MQLSCDGVVIHDVVESGFSVNENSLNVIVVVHDCVAIVWPCRDASILPLSRVGRLLVAVSTAKLCSMLQLLLSRQT